jgi:murein DD-endopeptidase MepM/ murein hydrolase activator NlpD
MHRTLFFCGLTLLLLAGLGADVVAQNSCQVPTQCVRPDWNWPRSSRYLSSTYFDRNYPRDPKAAPPRQHLGVDLGAPADTRIESPAAGTLIRVHASRDPAEAYIVIRESATGYDHVLGHVTTTYREGRRVARGEYVARVMSWPGNSHVHWGTNRDGVERAMGVSSRRGWGSGNWGWGRAPVSATRSEASERGWIDPERFAR